MSGRKRIWVGVMALGVVAGTLVPVLRAADGPPDGPPPAREPGGGGGGGGGGEPGGPGGPPPPGGPGGGGFHLIPRFAEEKIALTDAQKKQVAALEAETKAKLAKILTPEQMKAMEAARPPRGPGGGPGGEGGPGGGGGGPGGAGGGPGGAGGGPGGAGGGPGAGRQGGAGGGQGGGQRPPRQAR